MARVTRLNSGVTYVLFAVGIALVLAIALSIAPTSGLTANGAQATSAAVGDEYVVLAWNDLGMHCYNRDFAYLAVLPPWNTLWAQVVKVGSPPELVTTGITVTYRFEDNTYSVGKSNFWDYDADLFSVDLPPNVGLTGNGLSGDMEPQGNYWTAEGIPLTEFTDSSYEANPSRPYPQPFQMATIEVWDAATGERLAETTVVAPVSTEMHCDSCHSDGAFGIATGTVELNILVLHDRENAGNYPPGSTGMLSGRAPILCAECHASNALGMAGHPGLPSLSEAMHTHHEEQVEPTLAGCYACHPGPRTRCLRDVMSTEEGMDCIDCHGTMADVAANPDPWLTEPRCDGDGCHDDGRYDQTHALYRFSQGHGDLYCAACHDSPHTIAPSREPSDQIKFLDVQDTAHALGAEGNCGVCHTSIPADKGPHSIAPPQPSYSAKLVADQLAMVAAGETVTYTHRLQNAGTVSDTYELVWSSSQGWTTEVALSKYGEPVASPVLLRPGQMVEVAVAVTAPQAAHPGFRDTTVITATSQTHPVVIASVTDRTLIALMRLNLPIVLKSGY